MMTPQGNNVHTVSGEKLQLGLDSKQNRGMIFTTLTQYCALRKDSGLVMS